jgi:intein-encoded DNA endonuclease-like protein
MRMYKDGVGPTEISRMLGVKRRTVESWIYEGKKPPAARWHPEPNKELTYTIGVLNGDGSIVKDHKYHYDIVLSAKDIEFAEEFSSILARLLNKKYTSPYWSNLDNQWRITYKSMAFWTWYKGQTLDTLKHYIEHDEKTVAYFLRGLYDSEGYNYRCRQISLSNNSEKLLCYVQYLLMRYFDIIATGPYLCKKAGSVSVKKNGEEIKSNHDIYCIAINRRQHIQRFLSEIGFSIREKQLGQKRR